MLRSIWNSRAGMSATMEKMDTISNNLSNINTIGYKKVDVNFQSLVQETLKRQGYPTNDANAATGTGVKTSELFKDNSQGILINTEVKTDLALDGKGYFKVIDANGNEAYTRSGSFNIDSDGRIVDPNGNRLVVLNDRGQNVNVSNSNIRFNEKNFVVDENGNVLGNNFGNLRIPVYDALGDNSMKSIGKNLYSPEIIVDENGNQRQTQVFEKRDTNILQGHVENSNVKIEEEFSQMIINQRAFQLNSNALKTADEMWQMANNIRGR
ncbi:flagellar hook-basal body complex protein [Clostridium brassicae]|uniref:Flagellar hook-basal body complex protein n=1 Tax=Clostridium brassicae TaxID=2999072 RepID=A0ABT4DBE7_9CLOT|nr:flagellar hook-basal body complex protein [Clostridium brassicae]MCY6959623.1 flagellar hook-basal body complex protein [Clostridium brassicae]